jgi:hypothetical protein
MKAIALVGFFRGGQPVEPGTVFDVPEQEFAELKMFNLVEVAPPPKEEKRGK